MLLILALLLIVVAAPIVDAVACDDCRDIIPLGGTQPNAVNGMDRQDDNLMPSDASHSASRGTGTAKDLCPLCSNFAAAMDTPSCDAPPLISQTNQSPQVIAFSDPLYSVIKPPQN